MNMDKVRALEALGHCVASLASAPEEGIDWSAVRECFSHLGGTGIDKGAKARVMADAAYQQAERSVRQEGGTP